MQVGYKHPLGTGYRDLKIVFAGEEVTNGLLAEVQVQLRAIWKEKKGGMGTSHYTALRDSMGS